MIGVPRLADAPILAATDLCARGIDYRYGRVLALRSVDLDVPSGTVTALLGSNGAGKTTLLEVLATLRRPESGNIFVGSHDIRIQPTRARRQIGFVGHRNGHFPNLTCIENLMLHAGFHHIEDPDDAVARALESVGLTSWADRFASQLSHGAARRLSIARAILHSPGVLLFDEPYAGLDRSSAVALDELIASLAQNGRSIVLATHDVRKARTVCDRLVYIEDGRVAWTVLASDVDEDVLSGGAMPDAASSGSPPSTLGPNTDSAPYDQRMVDQTDDSGPLWSAAIAIARKDLTAEWRARSTLPATIVYALIIAIVFGYAFPRGPEALRELAPGALWVALLFGAMPGLSRAISADAESGALDSLRVSPIDRGALFVGPWLSAWGMSVVTAAALMPVVVALLGLDIAHVPALFGIAVLGLIGWSAAGVLTSAMAVTARAREILLPVILLPLVLPLILPAVTATAAALGDPNSQVAASLTIVGAYDVVFLVAGFLLLPFVLDG